MGRKAEILAKQFFKIAVPPNAIIYFSDESPAYLVKRFDVKQNGTKLLQEYFAQTKIIDEFKTNEASIDSLIDKSFLTDVTKTDYKNYYKDKVKRINMWPG